ncbi:MAG: hypothetical protein ACOH2A_03400 [Sphingobacteriaceae bacterium]
MLILHVACSQPPREKEKPRLSFKIIHGIKFTEVKRVFDSGYSFSENGYQLEPSWKLTIVSDDSVNIFSPTKKAFVNLPITFDHDAVFNIAWAWLRVKELTKDSIKFQVIKISGKEIIKKGPAIFMTLYANAYIKNKLKTDAQTLMRPTRRDTLFVREKASLANADFNVLFAARKPAALKSKSSLLIIDKVKVKGIGLENVVPEDEYLSPEYDLAIFNAYKNFDYSFSVIVDEKGQMHFGNSLVALSAEFRSSHLRIMKGILDGYVRHFVHVTAGETLGIPHTSKIILNVKGIKGMGLN